MNLSRKASISRLKLFSFKLNSLLAITKAINENLSTTELLKKYELILREDLNIGRTLIYKYDKNWKVILNSGCSQEHIKSINFEEDVFTHKEISFVTSSTSVGLQGFDNIIPVFNNNIPIAYVLIGDIDEESAGVSPTIKHLHFIQTLSNIIIVAIENIRLFKENLKQEALKKELELASKMQSMLIPEESQLPNNEKIKVSTFYHPHSEVGGDYYDFLSLNKNKIGFCIADVSGKGISAAILMSNFQANLRALFTPDSPLSEIVTKLNKTVLTAAKGEKFITLFIGRYDSQTSKLEYINAAHNPPFLYDIDNKKLSALKDGCVGMGMLDEIPTIQSGEITINHPSKLFCYTDGLVEIISGDKVSVRTQEIEECLKNDDYIDENIADIIKKQGILEDNTSIFDDISMIGIELF
ncbi:MAG: SpoIIE family protein phosphatase [Bacteroidales bacterium]|jgi:sigma-B regulation protein RsbU (phosphoserine phosphatase)|nr:SpoIIE family protein phosphatase [Bacteroidales bacterium]